MTALLNLRPLSLPLEVALLGLVLLFVDMASSSLRYKALTGWVTALGLTAILLVSFWDAPMGELGGGRYRTDAWSHFLNQWFLVAGVLVTLGSQVRVRRTAERRQGEYYLLLLFSLLGAVLLTGARDLILLLLCFELASIPLFVLAAIENGKNNEARLARTAEGAIKFFIVGVVSTPIALLGLAMILGMAGSSDLAVLSHLAPSPLVQTGVLLIIAGIGFKLGMAPFHMWVPDTYQSTPASFAAFLSTAPKLAALVMLSRLLGSGLAGQASLWVPVLAVGAGGTLLVGNVSALGQRSTHRMLAFSGVGHIGYFLMALIIGGALGQQALLFYGVAYLLTNIGAFIAVEVAIGHCEDDQIDQFAGLARRSPALALAMLVFLLSLAGIPFALGFWAKFYVFIEAWRSGHQLLVVLGALVAVVGLYYYLQIARIMYMVPPKEGAERPVVKPTQWLAIALCAAGVVGYGAWPAPLLHSVTVAAKAFVR